MELRSAAWTMARMASWSTLREPDSRTVRSAMVVSSVRLTHVAATIAGRPGVGAGDLARSRPALERTAESVHLTNNQIVSGSPDELVCVPYGLLDYLLDVGFLVILWQVETQVPKQLADLLGGWPFQWTFKH